MTNAPEVEAAFQAVPDEMVAEVVDGKLYTFPRPGRPQTRAKSRLLSLVGPFDVDLGTWVVLFEPELHFGPGPDKVVPDLAGWRRERMPDALGPDDAPAHYDLAPDFICEVISQGTERLDRGKKMRIYRREGVGHAWLINPIYQTLEVYRLEQGRWMLLDTHVGDALVRAEPFDAIELPLAALWAR